MLGGREGGRGGGRGGGGEGGREGGSGGGSGGGKVGSRGCIYTCIILAHITQLLCTCTYKCNCLFTISNSTQQIINNIYLHVQYCAYVSKKEYKASRVYMYVYVAQTATGFYRTTYVLYMCISYVVKHMIWPLPRVYDEAGEGGNSIFFMCS